MGIGGWMRATAMIVLLLVSARSENADVYVEFDGLAVTRMSVTAGDVINFRFEGVGGFLFIADPLTYYVNVGAGCANLSAQSADGCYWYRDTSLRLGIYSIGRSFGRGVIQVIARSTAVVQFYAGYLTDRDGVGCNLVWAAAYRRATWMTFEFSLPMSDPYNICLMHATTNGLLTVGQENNASRAIIDPGWTVEVYRPEGTLEVFDSRNWQGWGPSGTVAIRVKWANSVVVRKWWFSSTTASVARDFSLWGFDARTDPFVHSGDDNSLPTALTIGRWNPPRSRSPTAVPPDPAGDDAKGGSATGSAIGGSVGAVAGAGLLGLGFAGWLAYAKQAPEFLGKIAPYAKKLFGILGGDEEEDEGGAEAEADDDAGGSTTGNQNPGASAGGASPAQSDAANPSGAPSDGGTGPPDPKSGTTVPPGASAGTIPASRQKSGSSSSSDGGTPQLNPKSGTIPTSDQNSGTSSSSEGGTAASHQSGGKGSGSDSSDTTNP
jgi:hypothetical protein